MVIYRVGEAVRVVLNPARLYIAPLGSTYGNSHVHWHLIAVPEGVAQNTTWLSKKSAGVAEVADDAKAALARELRRALGFDSSRS